VPSRGGSNTLALPAGTKYVLASEASVICAVTAACGIHDQRLKLSKIVCIVDFVRVHIGRWNFVACGPKFAEKEFYSTRKGRLSRSAFFNVDI